MGNKKMKGLRGLAIKIVKVYEKNELKLGAKVQK